MNKMMSNPKVKALAAALCLLFSLAPRGAAQEQKPVRPEPGVEARLRQAFLAALGEHLEITRDELTRRSNWHGGGLYWLVHAKPKRTGHFSIRYQYRYVDPVNKVDPTHEFVEHKTGFWVSEKGCRRRPQSSSLCLGDTIILPVVVGDFRNNFTEHAFTLLSFLPLRASDKEQPQSAYEWLYDEKSFDSEPVVNPAEGFLKYVGRQSSVSPHRSLGYTMNFYATFEAAKPGSFNLLLGRSAPPETLPLTSRQVGSVPIIIVERGTPMTILASRENVRGYSKHFASTWGNSYITSPLILQPGDRITLPYSSFSRRGRVAEGSPDQTQAQKDAVPVITLLPFHVDPEWNFNEWIVKHLPVKKE